jgi:hypothetical protein
MGHVNTPPTANLTLDAFVQDEGRFLARANWDDLQRLVVEFRKRELEALTPQERDFYSDRVRQVWLEQGLAR